MESHSGDPPTQPPVPLPTTAEPTPDSARTSSLSAPSPGLSEPILTLPMWVKSARSLLPWITLASALLVWSFIGRIPIQAVGRGVIIAPREAVALESRAAGQVLNLNVETGDRVSKGQVLAVLDQPVLRQQLLQLQNHVVELQTQNLTVTGLQNQRTTQNLQDIRQRRQALEKQLRDLDEIVGVLKGKLDNLRKLADQGAIARLDVELVKVEDVYLQNLSQISNIRPQLAQLQTQERQIRLQDTEANLLRQNQIDALKRQIKVTESQLRDNSTLLSDYDGTILDLTINPGQFVTAGTRLGTVEQINANPKMQGISFFSVGDAKRIQPGMAIEITPTIESRERIGGILGKVTAIAQLPATEADISRLVGNDQIAKEMVAAGTVIQVISTLAPDPTGTQQFQWTLDGGTRFQILPGTTTEARVAVEQRPLMSYIFPGLRWITGVYR